jgi:hypothetical protein
MPFYLFQNIETEEVREIFFHMRDDKIYNGENNKEFNQWKRLWTLPNAAINSQPLDPFSKKDYAKWVGNGEKKLTIGNMQDRAAELSREREEKLGFDPIKEQSYKNYEKRTGKISPFKKREDTIKKFKKVGVTVDYENN